MTPIRITGEPWIEIGNRVVIGAGSWLQVLKQEKAGQDAVIQIGDGTSIAGYCTVSAVSSIVIEDSVLIARYVYIADHIHAHEDITTPIKEQGVTGVAPVRIGAGAWLGQSVVIGPGVTIGKGAVIGANSVVRNDVPDYCLAAGAPAKVIRRVDHRKDS